MDTVQVQICNKNLIWKKAHFAHSERVSGGASTHYQVLSAESRQYFRNAIPMSGTVDVLWAFSSDDHLKRAFNIAEELGEPKTTHEELISFLKSVPAKKLCPFSPLEQGVMFRIPVGPIAESMCKCT